MIIFSIPSQGKLILDGWYLPKNHVLANVLSEEHEDDAHDFTLTYFDGPVTYRIFGDVAGNTFTFRNGAFVSSSPPSVTSYLDVLDWLHETPFPKEPQFVPESIDAAVELFGDV